MQKGKSSDRVLKCTNLTRNCQSMVQASSSFKKWVITQGKNEILVTQLSVLLSSSGSRNFVEGGPRNMKYKPPCSVGIFS